jgi:predicted ATPase
MNKKRSIGSKNKTSPVGKGSEDTTKDNLVSFCIENFKAYKEYQEIKFAPLTFLYGPNSAGKSSLIQSILLAAQSQVKSGNSDLVVQGDFFEAGNIESLLHNKNTKEELIIGWKTRPKIEGYESGINCAYKCDIKKQEFQLTRILTENKTPINGYSYQVNLPWIKNEKPNSKNLIKEIRRVWETEPIWWIDTSIPQAKETIKTMKNLVFSYFMIQTSVKKIFEEMSTLEGALGFERERSMGFIDYENFQELGNFFNETIADLSEELRTKDISLSVEEDVKREEDNELWTRRYKIIESLKESKALIELIVDNFFLIQETGSPWPSPVPSFFNVTMTMQAKKKNSSTILFSPIVDAFYELNDIIFRAKELNKPFKDFGYIGPLRGEPRAFYKRKAEKNRNVGKRGENWVNNMIHSSKDVQLEISKWCNTLTGYAFEIVTTTAGNHELASVNLTKDSDSKSISVSLDNVGFGVSQLLPILAEGLSKQNSLIVVEQPEIHIHPRLQAEFVQFLIETSKIKNENGWLIETHSELMVLRVQKLLRENMLNPDDVAFYYCKPGLNGTEVMQLEIDEDGEFLDAWPDGFFDEGFYERQNTNY